MFYSPKLYLRDLWISLPLGIIVICELYIWGLVVQNIHPTREQIFLHYNVVFGIDFAGSWWMLYLLPFFGFGTLIVNFGVSFLFYKADRLLARFLAVSTALLNIFLAVAVNLIVGLNI